MFNNNLKMCQVKWVKVLFDRIPITTRYNIFIIFLNFELPNLLIRSSRQNISNLLLLETGCLWHWLFWQSHNVRVAAFDWFITGKTISYSFRLFSKARLGHFSFMLSVQSRLKRTFKISWMLSNGWFMCKCFQYIFYDWLIQKGFENRRCTYFAYCVSLVCL